jgi:hypothetical protein
MPSTYFALGTTLANMVNVETWADIPAHVLEEGVAALAGPVRTELMNAATRRDGFVPHAWRFDFESLAQFRTLVYQITGAFFTTQSRQVYISTIDESGYYSPFQCYVEKPYPQEHFRMQQWVRDIIVPFDDVTLQSVTKTANYTITTSDRLVYANTASGNITLTLPAAASVTAHTVYSVHKTSASNTLTIDGNASETINGALTATLTALNGRYDLVSDGTAWTSVTV